MVRTCFLLFLVGLDHGQTTLVVHFHSSHPSPFMGRRAVNAELSSAALCSPPTGCGLPRQAGPSNFCIQTTGEKNQQSIDCRCSFPDP